MSRPIMKHALSFYEVVYNWDDQVNVRKLMMKHVPQDAQGRILSEWNRMVDERNAIIAKQELDNES